MAEVQQDRTPKTKKPFPKRTKKSTRVDLTPMVDLGFLLITFFIFTSALAKPTAMKLLMPDDTSISDPLKASENRTLTLLVGSNDELFYYSGIFKDQLEKTNFKELRGVILKKKAEVFKKYGSGKMLILIKLSDGAKYKNVVDSLDEMVINSISTYMLVEPDLKELEVMSRVSSRKV